MTWNETLGRNICIAGALEMVGRIGKYAAEVCSAPTRVKGSYDKRWREFFTWEVAARFADSMNEDGTKAGHSATRRILGFI